MDVYIVPVTGGEPDRLTWHPGIDQVMGWTPDGNAVVFSSGKGRCTHGEVWRNFIQLGIDDAFPKSMPLPGSRRRHIPDGKSLFTRKSIPGKLNSKLSGWPV